MLRLRVTQRLPAAHEERPAGPQHDGRGERELNPVRQRRIDQAMAADEMAAHFQHDGRQREHEADPEAARHVGEFGIGRRIEARDLRLQRHAADRAASGADLADLRMHRAGVDRAFRHRGFRLAVFLRDRRRDRRRIWCGSRPSRNERSRRDSRSGACWSRGSTVMPQTGSRTVAAAWRDDRDGMRGRRGCGRRSRQPLARRFGRRFRSRSSSAPALETYTL